MSVSKVKEIRFKQLGRIIERLRGMDIERTKVEEAMNSLLGEGNYDWALVAADNNYFESIIGLLVEFIGENEQLKFELEGPWMEQAMDAMQFQLGIDRYETKKAVESLLKDNHNDWTVIEIDNYGQLIERIFSFQSGEAEQVPPAKSELEIVPRKGEGKRPNTTDEGTSNNPCKKQRLTSEGSSEQLVKMTGSEENDPYIKSKGKRPVFDTSAPIKEPLLEMPTPPSPRADSSAPGDGPADLADKEIN